MFAQALEDVLRDRCTARTVRGIEAGADDGELRGALHATGLFELLAPESAGGGDASWPEFHEVVRTCGAYALPLALPQTIAARRLFAVEPSWSEGVVTFAGRLARDGAGGLRSALVPFARGASHAIGVLEGRPLLLPLQGAQLEPAGLPANLSAAVRWPEAPHAALRCSVDAPRFEAIAAAIHASLLAGALQRTLDMTLGYANERVQFGKSIGKFQAVQHQLAVMAEHVAAASLAAEAAWYTVPDGFPAFAACAAAKARASEAAQTVASIAHAVHGAIGMAQEHDLQLYTRRLHEWRLAHGSEARWHGELGRLWFEAPQNLVTDFARSLFA